MENQRIGKRAHEPMGAEMIDDLDRMDIKEAHTAFAAAAQRECPCVCECNCLQCDCHCSAGDCAYDQDTTYLHYPSDTWEVRGNPRTLGWEGIYVLVY